MFSREERERHIYIVGKSGSGKSTFLFNLAMSDISRGEGVAVIDPHGDLALDILDAIPRSRISPRTAAHRQSRSAKVREGGRARFSAEAITLNLRPCLTRERRSF